jgi:hypothetical protein
MRMFQIIFNKLFGYLFARMLASHHGGPGSIPNRDMSVSGALVDYEDDLDSVFP